MERYFITCDMCKTVIPDNTQRLRVKFTNEGGGKASKPYAWLDVCKKCETETDIKTFVDTAYRIANPGPVDPTPTTDL
jgi:hypothetical protein